MGSESEEMMMPDNGEDSPPIDDANGGGNGQLKKGPWTSAEDAILMEYVMKHGEGNWNAVQKHSGLARCGKSCRLRWANHLRPDLKKGAFTPEEERRIIELHAKMGNKWARMAAELPGRTDNEIKNYWNTRIKRRQRAGLPIYPSDICFQAFKEKQQSDNMDNTFSPGDMHHQGYAQVNNIEFPAVEFKGLELNQQMFTPPVLDIPASNLLDIPASSLLAQGGLNCPYRNKTLLTKMHPSKRFRGSEESQFPILSPIPGGGPFQNYGSAPYPQSCLFSSEHDHHNSSVVLPGPPSEPSWAMKMELPSLQTPQMGNWGSTTPSSPVPSLDSVDTLIQTPPTDNLSPRNSGLLDAVLYESQTKTIPRGSGRHHLVDNNSYNDLHDTEWEVYGEQLSPLGHSSSSVFSENTPISANSLDELNSGYKLKQEPNYLDMAQYDTADQMIFPRSDFLLGSNCFGPMKDPSKDHNLLKDAIGTYLRDELSSDCKQMDADTTSAAQDYGHGHNLVLGEPDFYV